MLKVILDREIPIYIKVPYLRFLEGVYFSFEEEGEQTHKSSRKFDEVNIIDLLTNKANLANFRLLLDNWTMGLFDFNEKIYRAKKEAIENPNNLDSSNRQALEIKAEFYDFYIIDVLLPLIGDLFETSNLETLWEKAAIDPNMIMEDEEDEEGDEDNEEEEQPDNPGINEQAANFIKRGSGIVVPLRAIRNKDEDDDHAEDDEEEEDEYNMEVDDNAITSQENLIANVVNTSTSEIFLDRHIKTFLHMIENWVNYICNMASDHLVIANESRRGVYIYIYIYRYYTRCTGQFQKEFKNGKQAKRCRNFPG